MTTGPHEASVKPVDLTRPAGLEGVALGDLVRETIARLETCSVERPTVRLLHELARRVAKVVSGPENRFSAAHLQELLGTYFFWQRDVKADLRGEVFLELGAGSEAPLQVCSAMVALGAERGFALELTPPLSDEAQAQALGDVLYWLLGRPDLFEKLDLHSFRSTIVRCSPQFDIGALGAGRLVLPSSVQMIVGSAEATGLPASSVHRVASTSFLEHVDDPEAVVAEIARVTAPGGLSVHNVDTADHGFYERRADSPIAFLLEQPGPGPVRGCNRRRIPALVRLFEERGFSLQKRNDYETHRWTPEQLQALVPPFSQMPREELVPLKSVLVFRRD